MNMNIELLYHHLTLYGAHIVDFTFLKIIILNPLRYYLIFSLLNAVYPQIILSVLYFIYLVIFNHIFILKTFSSTSPFPDQYSQ